MTRFDGMLSTLRTLDAADSEINPASPRARIDLEHILASGPAPTGIGLRRPVARPMRRVVMAGTAVVAVSATAVVVPSLMGGDPAFASWTAVPQGMSPAEETTAAEGCRKAQQDGPAADYADELAAASIAIAERRGEWTTVLLAGADGFSALCVTDDSTHLFKDWIGSVGRPSDYQAPASRAVVATDLGTGSARAGELSLAAGMVGSDVAAISFDSESRGTVEATVSHGHFALWLPGGELEEAPTRGVSVTVTYRDGSTATVRLHL